MKGNVRADSWTIHFEIHHGTRPTTIPGAMTRNSAEPTLLVLCASHFFVPAGYVQSFANWYDYGDKARKLLNRGDVRFNLLRVRQKLSVSSNTFRLQFR